MVGHFPLSKKFPLHPRDIPFDWKVYASRERRRSDVYVAHDHCYGGKEIMLETWTFEITGEQKMACSGCENTVQRSLTRLLGIRKAQADHQTQRVVVQLDTTQTNAETIKARLAASGYQAHQLAAPTAE